MDKEMTIINRVIDLLFKGPSLAEIKEINRRIFELPIEGIPPKEELFNKHLQNLVWCFLVWYCITQRLNG